MMGDDEIKINNRLLAVGVTIVLFLITQTVGGIWWAATQATTLAHVRADVSDLKDQMSDRYRGEDAARDLALRDRQIQELREDYKAMRDEIKELRKN